VSSSLLATTHTGPNRSDCALGGDRYVVKPLSECAPEPDYETSDDEKYVVQLDDDSEVESGSDDDSRESDTAPEDGDTAAEDEEMAPPDGEKSAAKGGHGRKRSADELAADKEAEAA